MEYILLLLIFTLGASVASFLIVFLERGLSIKKIAGIKNFSYCDNCKKNLDIISLIPIFGFLIRKGKCKHCNSKVSILYPLGELFLGLSYVGIYLNFLFTQDFLMSFLQIILFSTLLMVSYEDLKDMEVTGKLLYIILSIALIKNIIYFDMNPLIWSLMISSPFWAVYLISRGKYMGLGDPILITAINIFYGLQFSISLFLYSVWFGAFCSIAYLSWTRWRQVRNVRIPFIPMIACASLYILIFQFHIIKIGDILLINEVFFK